jgi:hypothetical protein
MTKTMMLITGAWGQKKTFKMIPVTTDCPYNEAIYDAEAKVLALVSKEKKQSMHMVAKLDDFGDVKPMKVGRRTNGKDYAEERKTLETYYEYYLETPEEIKAFISLIAVNADSFDVNQYLNDAGLTIATNSIVTV